MIFTTHRIIIDAAQSMHQLKDESIQLVVTSPPYPMIEMWDSSFASQNPIIETALKISDAQLAFEQMHIELDKVWFELSRVVVAGGFVCVNIGDATRSVNQQFALYSNHSRIITAFTKLGFVNLPNILWRKQTNAPNKFMGSGMLPAGAYVTLEHEWILIFRKGNKPDFKTQTEKLKRKQSAYFWNERNAWFSDVWDLKGIRQIIHKNANKTSNKNIRNRSAAFPFEIPYRLINMYSLQGDTILDPFLGTATTMVAAIAANRNSIGFEIESDFSNIIIENILSVPLAFYNKVIQNRIESQQQFIESNQNREFKHYNKNLNLPVMTNQETEILFRYIKEITTKENENQNEVYAVYR